VRGELNAVALFASENRCALAAVLVYVLRPFVAESSAYHIACHAAPPSVEILRSAHDSFVPSELVGSGQYPSRRITICT
jgi:hypothetical protein